MNSSKNTENSNGILVPQTRMRQAKLKANENIHKYFWPKSAARKVKTLSTISENEALKTNNNNTKKTSAIRANDESESCVMSTIFDKLSLTNTTDDCSPIPNTTNSDATKVSQNSDSSDKTADHENRSFNDSDNINYSSFMATFIETTLNGIITESEINMLIPGEEDPSSSVINQEAAVETAATATTSDASVELDSSVELIEQSVDIIDLDSSTDESELDISKEMNFSALLIDDPTDDEADKNVSSHSWFEKGKRIAAVRGQDATNKNVIDKFFGSGAMTIDLFEVFPKIDPVETIRRRSSMHWNPPVPYSMIPKH